MRLLIACALLLHLSVTSGERLLGANKCTWGPAYWCKHAHTMKECNTATVCGRDWRNVRLFDDDSEDCSFCQLLASDLRKLQQANKTEDQIRMSALAACGLVPENSKKYLCKSLVNSYLREMLHLLRQLPNAKVCAAHGLCRSERRVPRVQFESVPNRDTDVDAVANSGILFRGAPIQMDNSESEPCDKCVEIMNDVKKAVESNKTSEEISDTLRDICSVMGPLESRCNSAVNEFLPQILKFIDNGIKPKEICQLIGLCASQWNRNSSRMNFRFQRKLPLVLRQMRSPLGTECEICKLVVTEAKQLLSNNKTDQEILIFLENRICSLLSAEKDTCVSAVREYGEVLMQLIASKIDAASVCKILGTCISSEQQEREVGMATQRLKSATPQCIACELVMRELSRLLGDNKTEPAIESALERVCSVLPQTVRQECDEIVQDYTPALVKLLAQDLAPELVCRTIGLCATLNARDTQLKQLRMSPCDFCRTGIIYVKSYLNDEHNIQKFDHFLSKVCNFLSDQYHNQCTDFMAKVGSFVMRQIANDLNPQELCEDWKACDPPKIKNINLNSTRVRNIGSRSGSSSGSGSSDETIQMSQIN